MARNFLDVIRARQSARDFAMIEPAEPAEPVIVRRATRTPAGFAAEEAGRSTSLTAGQTAMTMTLAIAPMPLPTPAIERPRVTGWDALIGAVRDERAAPMLPLVIAPPADQADQLRADAAAAGITPAIVPAITPTDAPETKTLAGCRATIEAIEPAAELERVQEAILMRDWLCEQVKLIDAACKERTLNWIETNKREITIGPVRYYAGLESETKCRDVPATIEAILTATAGDFTAACGCLSANAIKHGAASKTLAPDVYGKLFSTEKKIVLKEGKPAKRTDGSPALQLIKTNDDFNK